MIALISPYWGVQFFHFFSLLFQRTWLWITGQLSIDTLAADEIQILVLSFIAVAAGVISPFLVLRRMTMVANALSHTTLVGILAAYTVIGHLDLFSLCLGALFAALITVALMEFLQKVFRLTEDASMGLVFTFLFALGILGVSLFFRDLHLGIETVMGNVDALRLEDVGMAFFLLLLNVLGIVVFYHPLKLTSFDLLLARSLGISSRKTHLFLMVLTAVTTVGAMRAVGVLLILAFFVIPYLTARLMCHRLHQLVILTPMIGVVAACLGVALSRHCLTMWDLPLSTGGMVVCVMSCVYFLAFAVRQGIHFFLPRRRVQSQ